MAAQVTLSPTCADVLYELRRRPCTTRTLTRATGVMRIGAIIHVLRIAGFRIDTELQRVRNRHGNKCFIALYTLRRSRRQPAKSRQRAKR